MPFWRFSLRFYRQPGVADACIALQDECGVDVNILLFMLWLATDKRRIAPAALAALCATACDWNQQVVAPLRTLRRRLKTSLPLVDMTAAEPFRTKVKALELESERLQQEALQALAPELATTIEATIEAAARANLAAYEHVIGRGFIATSQERLFAALALPPASREDRG